MMLPDSREARYDWLISQMRWHKARKGNWHKSQARHYAKAVRGIPGVMNVIVGRVLMRSLPEIAASVARGNALFRRLKARGPVMASIDVKAAPPGHIMYDDGKRKPVGG